MEQTNLLVAGEETTKISVDVEKDLETSEELQENLTQEEIEELKRKKIKELRTKCEVYSRIVGYIRAVEQWNDGKQAEWEDRKVFNSSCCN